MIEAGEQAFQQIGSVEDRHPQQGKRSSGRLWWRAHLIHGLPEPLEEVVITGALHHGGEATP